MHPATDDQIIGNQATAADILAPLSRWIVGAGACWTISAAIEILAWSSSKPHVDGLRTLRWVSILFVGAGVLMFMSCIIHAAIINRRTLSEVDDEGLRQDVKSRISYIFYVLAGLQAALLGARIFFSIGLIRFALSLLATSITAWTLRREAGD